MKPMTYTISLAELVRSAQVPVEKQRTVHPDPPAEPMVPTEVADQLRFLGTAAGF